MASLGNELIRQAIQNTTGIANAIRQAQAGQPTNFNLPMPQYNGEQMQAKSGSSTPTGNKYPMPSRSTGDWNYGPDDPRDYLYFPSSAVRNDARRALYARDDALPGLGDRGRNAENTAKDVVSGLWDESHPIFRVGPYVDWSYFENPMYYGNLYEDAPISRDIYGLTFTSPKGRNGGTPPTAEQLENRKTGGAAKKRGAFPSYQ